MKQAGVEPRLSVVLTLVDGGTILREAVERLLEQREVADLEILLPYDDSVAQEVERLANPDPRLRLLPMGRIETARPIGSAAGQHELFDRRRARGLAEARAPLVGILEDRGLPAPDWARAMIAAHRDGRAAAIGGPVLCGETSALARAVYFCDFSRYQPPITAGPAAWVTDVNVVYDRRALYETRELWQDRYHETTVHWELQRRGSTLELRSEPLVSQHRRGLALGRVLRERFQWGRLFAFTRAREIGSLRRLVLALGCLFLPFILLLRHGRNQIAKREHLASFLLLSPLVLLLLVAWSAGEAAAYLGARP